MSVSSQKATIKAGTVGARDRRNAGTMLDGLESAIKAVAVADLTENSGAIGGTNDGDLPDLSTPSAALNAEAVREVADKLNDLMATLRTAGLLST